MSEKPKWAGKYVTKQNNPTCAFRHAIDTATQGTEAEREPLFELCWKIGVLYSVFKKESVVRHKNDTLGRSKWMLVISVSCLNWKSIHLFPRGGIFFIVLSCCCFCCTPILSGIIERLVCGQYFKTLGMGRCRLSVLR